MRQVSRRIYAMAAAGPGGLKKIEQIVREEQNRAGASNC